MKTHIERLTKELFPLGLGIASQFVGQMYSLPPARFGVKTKRDVDIVARDGIALKTDIYTPKGKGPHPTLLMRTPYGRLGFGVVAKIYAERGFRTLLQACRGTDGSDGVFDPLINERADGLATLDWIKQQKWYDGRMGLTGPSYLGFAQWAICDELPQGAAISAKVTASNFESVVFPGGAFHLQLWLSWLQTIYGLENELFGMTVRMATGDVERRTARTALTLPLAEADIAAVGEEVPFWRQWFGEAIDNDEFWKARDHSARLDETTPPNSFVSGWYDIMIDQHLADYQRLVAAGHSPHLTIGPWYHTDNELQGECLRQTISWMSAHLLKDEESLRRNPVRIFITGKDEWLNTEKFPPAAITDKILFLSPNHRTHPTLRESPVAENNQSDRYSYDPADPTPNLGGAIFAFQGAGAQDNHNLEIREDVLIYTSAPLGEDLTIIGNVGVRLFVRSSLQYTDFFARLCDVDQNSISTNISDAIIRLSPDTTERDADGIAAIEITLHATAHTFLKGHCIRLQVSSGAHPRYARNLGTSEPIGTATRMKIAEQEIFHDQAHQSAVILPVCKI